jgi:hypothetical protein
VPEVLKLSSNVSDVFPKVLKLSSEVSECKPLGTGMYIINYISQRAGNATLSVFLEQRVDATNSIVTESRKAGGA